MTATRLACFSNAASSRAQGLGTAGYLAIFVASLAAVMFVPVERLPWTAGCALLAALWIYPRAWRSVMRLRWLVMIALMALPPVFLVGEIDSRFVVGDWVSIPYSSEGLMSALQIVLRIVVVLVSVQGLTSSIDISSIAGLLERAGLHGLGFSVGVALNLLPALQQSAQNAWRSLWMRGGLRKQRLRSLRLLAVTIAAGALNRAEEIALAAEARAFSPEKARSLPVRTGRWDPVALVVCALLTLVCIFLL